MPDFSAHTFSSAAEMKFHLQSLLDSKEKQIQQIGILGQRLLTQQAELDERVRQLQEIEGDKSEDEDMDTEARERYRDLAEVISTWDTENAQLSSTLGSKRPNGKQASPSMPLQDLQREEPERSKVSASSAAQSRRAKNAAHRADDVEFAFEIGSGLLTEVRRLQSLLGERDKAIQDMKEEKDDFEKTVESLRTALRSQEQSSDKYKEENWNLEVTLQELRTQLSESQSTTIRLEGEHKRLTKLLNGARETTDQHKNETERLKNVYDDLKAKHETDIAQARKHAAGLQRDKSDLQSTLDSMKAEVAKANRRLPRFGSPLTPNGQDAKDFLTPADQYDDDVFTTGGASTNNRRKLDSSAVFPVGEFGEFGELSPDPSPSRTFLVSNHPSNEIEALQQRLAHAQRQINTLKGTLNREKELRIEYKRKLDSSPGSTPYEEDPPEDDWAEEDGDADAEGENKTGRRLTPFRSRGGRTRGGRGRGRGGLTLAQRLGMAASSPSSEYNFDEFNDNTASPPPPVPAIPDKFHDAGDVDSDDDVIEEEEEPEPEPRSPSPVGPSSNRTSIDGMDPMFANVLRRSASFNSIPNNSSPLRQSVVARPARGGASLRRSRGGAAYQEVRPPSLVGQPEALAAELGLGGFETSIAEDDLHMEIARETAEFSCQTDFEDVELVVPTIYAPVEPTTVLPPTLVTCEVAVQVEPEPEPAPVIAAEQVPAPEPQSTPSITTVEISCQTDEQPVIAHSEIAVQYDYYEPSPVLVSTSMNTEPEEIPIAPLVPVMAQAEVQTVSVSTANIDVQTSPAPVILPVERVHMNTQTPLAKTVEIETQTPTPSSVHQEVQAQGTRVFAGPTERDTSRRTTITQYDYSRTSLGNTSGDSTLRNVPARLFLAERDEDEDDVDDGATETGMETETDTDDYEDARQSIGMTTPSESREDFHSVLTMTDNDFSESDDDDDESIKASRMPSRAGMSSTDSLNEEEEETQYRIPSVTYESKGVSAELIEVPEPIKDVEPVEIKPAEVEVVKPELREISVQTDEWAPPPVVPVQVVVPVPPVSVASIPPPPPVAPTPVVPAPATTTAPSSAAVPTAFGLYRVGSTGQQFQFVTPPSPKPSAVSSAIPAVVPAPTGSIRDSGATFGIVRPRTSQSDRRQSIESAITSAVDDGVRSRVPSSVPSIVDKSRPPMMVLPPPPRQPPPNSMPPPAFIPERRVPTSSSASHDVPPPRPSSPPPAELIQRATTPTFGSMLSVHARGSYGPRQHGSSMPPSQSSLRQPPSTRSFRSAANAAAYATQAVVPSNLTSWSVREKERRELSSTSLTSDRSALSPRSSMSSDHNVFVNHSHQHPSAPATPEKSADQTMRAGDGGSTDPTVIHAITQTMIGEFLYKYTRRALGKGYGERRHKRFFWVHPYTKTLYWSSLDPGSSNVSESSAKSAYIEGVRSVLDPNPMPPGLYQYSVVVSTPQREMKITAPTKERHDIWLNALKYLLARPNSALVGTPANDLNPAPSMSPMSQSAELTDDDHRQLVDSSPQSQRSGRTGRNGGAFSTTPRGQRSRSQLSVGGSVGKRSGTPAAEYLRWAGPESPYSPTKSFEQIMGQGHDEEDLDFELHGESMDDDGFEGLENVRACCDGRHTVGRSGKHHHHHHHVHNGEHHLDVHPAETARPASPAWSFRSRTGSAHSHEGGTGGGLFSWGRADGKLRFGSRRSNKTVSSTVTGAHDP
ncbi:hypothetical protein SERLA73DRAFT_165305 [Serpula lacrymans var. lacrymans S7.3]|uniref:PH domain-containing protein n=1 Tax=Serpula lacrymans var. lacrymans (strain S7.3) TaxID=936435 RepID=F8PIQ3_SERL3|nr:hypothetical protein SERLA73DRAFT_165305 [Serpula lacrymans var. lacrymans S7.3]